tara:strand:- start:895 stop:1491 length:597 start_codon:yes stop_codon:yes gene_type:complete
MRTHEGQAKSLKPKNFQKVIDYTRNNSAYPLLHIALLQVSYRCGLRAMEIAGLNLRDLMTSNGDINKHIPLRKKTTKGSRGGVAFFTHPEVRAALLEYIVEVRSSISTKYDNVFISRKHTPFTPSSMSRLFTKIYVDAGYEGCTGHSGRKSLAHNLNAENVSVYNIQKILRHASITTTVNHYLAVDEEVLANIVGNAV